MDSTHLTGSRDAPDISTLPPDVALFAVEKAVPLLQELKNMKIILRSFGAETLAEIVS